MTKIQLGHRVTDENFNEEGYLLANLDVMKAVREQNYATGRNHFDIFGKNEPRFLYTTESLKSIEHLRQVKLEKIAGQLRNDMTLDHKDGKLNFLTEELKREFNIIDTDNVSANSYDEKILSLIDEFSDGMILDCGSGLHDAYYSNVYNYDIADFITADILGVGEELPFKDETFDAVISVAVLEHVKNPFKCAAEISRVLKKGGKLLSSIPFLQPYHGYPHHYYNMTHQGHENLYAETISIDSIEVVSSATPIHFLTWFLQKYVNGLQTDETREQFLNMRVSEFMISPDTFLANDIVKLLDKRQELELASATVLTGIKK